MSIRSPIARDDTILPFQLDRANVRGRVARLDRVLDDIVRQHGYPDPVEHLLIETAILTALIGQSIKLRWKLSIQIRGNGPVRLIATDYYAPELADGAGRLRAYASFDPQRLSEEEEPFTQIGQGYFTIQIDQGAGSLPYQGITPITGGSLSACAETYFSQSEQLPTRFALSYGQSQIPGEPHAIRAGGILLQYLPKASQEALDEASKEGALLSAQDILSGSDLENWQRVNLLLDTVRPDELIDPALSPTDLLVRLFHQETPRIYDAQSIAFGCNCSLDRVRQSLSIYSPKDIAHMTTSEGVVTADCQFCGAHYVMDPTTVGMEAAEHEPPK